jgi:glyoxylase-like metal-dependent hydrolase (beta-lactamase superfamily II)
MRPALNVTRSTRWIPSAHGDRHRLVGTAQDLSEPRRPEMTFRQLFDTESSSSTYLVADPNAGEALLIDPVLDRVPQYAELIGQLGLRLVLAVDTHVHTDYITGLGALRDASECVTAMGEQTQAECVSAAQ